MPGHLSLSKAFRCRKTKPALTIRSRKRLNCNDPPRNSSLAGYFSHEDHRMFQKCEQESSPPLTFRVKGYYLTTRNMTCRIVVVIKN